LGILVAEARKHLNFEFAWTAA
jgi:hypothetical protein